jgi:hypothetical protein
MGQYTTHFGRLSGVSSATKEVKIVQWCIRTRKNRSKLVALPTVENQGILIVAFVK